jgi:hypothetical protein
MSIFAQAAPRRCAGLCGRWRTMSNDTERKKYTLSPQAIAQRRAASEAGRALSTGPKTTEGKAASSRNAWKHGEYSAINRAQFGLGAASLSKMFGKPCQTTCQFHPDNPGRTEMPCGLVLDGLTHAGGSCLDKTVYVHALDALMAAMSSGEMDGTNGLLAKEMASNLQVVDHIRQAVAEFGVLQPIYKHDHEGEVILDPRTEAPMVFELKINPAIMALAKFSETMGLNFAELMATPRAREKLNDADNAADGLQSMIGGIMARMGKRSPRTLEHDKDE